MGRKQSMGGFRDAGLAGPEPLREANQGGEA